MERENETAGVSDVGVRRFTVEASVHVSCRPVAGRPKMLLLCSISVLDSFSLCPMTVNKF